MNTITAYININVTKSQDTYDNQKEEEENKKTKHFTHTQIAQVWSVPIWSSTESVFKYVPQNSDQFSWPLAQLEKWRQATWQNIRDITMTRWLSLDGLLQWIFPVWRLVWICHRRSKNLYPAASHYNRFTGRKMITESFALPVIVYNHCLGRRKWRCNRFIKPAVGCAESYRA